MRLPYQVIHVQIPIPKNFSPTDRPRATPEFFPPRRHIFRRANRRIGFCVSAKKTRCRNVPSQKSHASAQKFTRHGAETLRTMPRNERGGVAAKRAVFGKGEKNGKIRRNETYLIIARQI